MTKPMPLTPTRDGIEAGDFVEGTALDFKQKVDLASGRGKVKLLDDVVAMLNTAAGHLVIGVAEEKGRFRHFEPINEDRDAFERRLVSIILDGVEPRPLRVEMTSFEVDGGFVAVLHVPWHGRRAFQNKLTGGFLGRTGARNVPLTRDEVRALFTPEDDFAKDALALIERENARCVERRLMQDDGPTFHLAVIPEERYERGRRPFDRGHGFIKAGPLFHDDRGAIFQPCQDGFEALEITFTDAITRVFVGSDWSMYVRVSHPFHNDQGRVTIYDFGKALPEYVFRVAEVVTDDLHGPFCLAMAATDLRRSQKVAWAFPHVDEVRLPPSMTDRIDDADEIERFAQSLIRSSRYG